MKSDKTRRWEVLIVLPVFLLLAVYVGGFVEQIMTEAVIQLNPLVCFRRGIESSMGIKFSVAVLPVFALIAVTVVWRGNGREVAARDEERNFDYSVKGTYGTAGYMTKEEQDKILEFHKSASEAEGVIFGTDPETGKVISLPVNSPLNRNFAVCGSQGSMKSRAFARVMALQCVKRGESMYVTDPKSELYEDLVIYLREQGYVCRQLNLIDLMHSDSWDCLGEIDDGGLIDVFVDVVIRNTTDKFDHFYDNVEMDLLKALCLYVYEEYPPERRTFPEAYNLLLNKDIEALDSIFDRLPTGHPAKGPYRLFSKAEKVKGNAVLGLGTRLQILQNKTVQKITSHKGIDLTLPGKQKCAYFCITSDQDSTYDMLATLFTSFLCIKLVRLADRTPDRKLPVSVHFILDEFPNIGVVPDFKKKLATARSRGLGMSVLYQNIPQLQNRYPDNQWEEILGGCDFSLFLGCNDMTTAEYFSERTGTVTVAVNSVRKNYYTIRMTDYVPQYTESSSLGKRQLLLPDEVLRFPLDQVLLFIRGQRVMRVKKMDFTLHPDAEKLVQEKTDAYIPDWRKEEIEKDDEQASVEEREVVKEVAEEDTEKKPDRRRRAKQQSGDGSYIQLSLFEEAEEPLAADTVVKKRGKKRTEDKSGGTEKKITKVEDLFGNAREREDMES